MGAIASRNEMMGQLLTKIQKLEEKNIAPSQPLQNSSFLHKYPQTARRRPGSSSHQLVCWNCGRRGHIARLCRNPKMQGNEKPPAMWVNRLEGYKYKRLEIFLFHLFLQSLLTPITYQLQLANSSLILALQSHCWVVKSGKNCPCLPSRHWKLGGSWWLT